MAVGMAGPTHWPKTNAVMLRNRRVGTSMSGLAQVRHIGPTEHEQGRLSELMREWGRFCAVPCEPRHG